MLTEDTEISIFELRLTGSIRSTAKQMRLFGALRFYFKCAEISILNTVKTIMGQKDFTVVKNVCV